MNRETLDDLGNSHDHIWHVTCRVGFNDSQDVPKALRLAIDTFDELKHLREEDAMYFLSVGDIKRDPSNHCMPLWRKRVFKLLSRVQADINDTYHTPKERTVVQGVEIYL